jgi:hypothetical protein
MKIMHLGIAVWPSWAVAQSKMWIWLKSVERFKYNFQYYGVGTRRWPGYRAQKVESQLDWLLKHGTGGATHIHYTDCCDCLVMAPADEFEAKYKGMGSPPMLVQAASQLGNVGDDRFSWFEADGRPERVGKFRYPCVGGYIMEAKLLLEFLKKMNRDYPESQGWGDDCFIWYEGFQQGWFRPEMDSQCQLWQVCHEADLVVAEVEGIKRLANPMTGSFPCIWHNSGGSANQETFKDEQMIPMARKLGIIGAEELKPV